MCVEHLKWSLCLCVREGCGGCGKRKCVKLVCRKHLCFECCFASRSPGCSCWSWAVIWSGCFCFSDPWVKHFTTHTVCLLLSLSLYKLCLSGCAIYPEEFVFFHVIYNRLWWMTLLCYVMTLVVRRSARPRKFPCNWATQNNVPVLLSGRPGPWGHQTHHPSGDVPCDQGRGSVFGSGVGGVVQGHQPHTVLGPQHEDGSQVQDGFLPAWLPQDHLFKDT